MGAASDADIERKYNLDKRSVEFSQTCKQVMGGRVLRFRPNVSNVQGCACMAGRLSPMSDTQMVLAGEMMQVTMTAMLAQNSPVLFHEQLEALRRSQTSSRKVFSETLEAVHRSLRHCGDQTTTLHRDPQLRLTLS